jgi:hypothetical protein
MRANFGAQSDNCGKRARDDQETTNRKKKSTIEKDSIISDGKDDLSVEDQYVAPSLLHR